MPTNNTLYISTQHLKDNTVINNNVDNELLEPFIIQAQNKHIEPIIGTGLFNEIKTNIQNNTVSGDTKTLLDDYIQPCLKEWVLYESLPFINYKLTNKSVGTKSSDNSEPAELNELQYLRKNVRDTAEYMSQRLTDYLKTEVNNGKFSLYQNAGNTIDTIRPNSSSYFNGIYLPKGNDCDCNDFGIGIPLN